MGEKSKTEIIFTNTSISFTGLLTVAFVVLKLTGVIAWSWLWVLAPLRISSALAILIIVIFLVVALIVAQIVD